MTSGVRRRVQHAAAGWSSRPHTPRPPIPALDDADSGEGDTGLSIALLNWRDTAHPEGGGSEVYAEQLADGLATAGHRVTLFTAAYAGARAEEVRPSGVRVLRRGSHQSLYLHAPWQYRRGNLGRPDVVVEVHNGMPFLARLWAHRRTPVVVLVHHVHREQWHVVFGPARARIGWWLEAWVAPRVNRRCHYVAVSDVTRDELVELGVASERIEVIHNGTPALRSESIAKTDHPSLLVLGRLVPHKRVEIALAVLGRLRAEFPGLTLTVAGRGWWENELRAEAARLGVADSVAFAGFVSDEDRHRLYSQSWVSLVPSLKEGWGLVVVEAGVHGTPSVAFFGAGGVAESIVDGFTGLLAARDDVDAFTACTRRLLTETAEREQMGRDARTYAGRFTWDATIKSFDALLGSVTDR
ncbi:MAG: glycosyltransferase family 4 protein [bacterium]